jgi:hypothetical protein
MLDMQLLQDGIYNCRLPAEPRYFDAILKVFHAWKVRLIPKKRIFLMAAMKTSIHPAKHFRR